MAFAHPSKPFTQAQIETINPNQSGVYGLLRANAWIYLGRGNIRERLLGHLHGDHAAHFFFPKDVWAELYEQGRIVHHPVFPGRVGPAARRIEDDADVCDVIELMRLNYERLSRRAPS